MENDHRAHPLFYAMMFVSSVAVLIPVWTPDYLPLTDWPQHLAIISVLGHLGDQELSFGQYVIVDGLLTTYMGFYGPAALLARFVSVDTAARLLLSLFFVGTPLSLGFVMRGCGRSPYPALLAFPILYCWPLYYGFIAYLLAVPLLMIGLGLVERQCRRATGRGLLGLALLLVLTFFTHALVFLLLGAIMLPSVFLLCGRHWRRATAVLATGVPSLILFGYWFAGRFYGSVADLVGAGNAAFIGDADLKGISYTALGAKLSSIPEHLDGMLTGSVSRAVVWLWLGGMVLMLAGGLVVRYARRGSRQGRDRAGSWAAPVLFSSLLIAAYLSLPLSVAGVWGVSPRLVVVAALGLCLLVPPMFRDDVWNLLSFTPALVLTMLVSATQLEHFRGCDREATGLREVVGSVEPGKRVYGLVYDARSRFIRNSPFLHSAAYYMVERGGIAGFTFFHNNPSVPIRLRNPAIAPYPGRRGEWEPRRWRYDLYGPYYDYLLVRGVSDAEDLRRRVGAPPGVLMSVAREGSWAVYRNRGVDPGRPVFSMLEQIHRARIRWVRGADQQSCRREGLRWQCPQGDWSWVGPALPSFDQVPVPCIRAPAASDTELRLSFVDLPPAARLLRGFVGVPDRAFSTSGTAGPSGSLRVLIDGQPVAAVSPGARRGYQTFSIPIPEERRPLDEITVVIRADRSDGALLCFGATLFDGPPGPPAPGA